jgi:hypothetical protein
MESLKKINDRIRKACNKAAQKYYELFHNELEEKEFDKKFLNYYLKL